MATEGTTKKPRTDEDRKRDREYKQRLRAKAKKKKATLSMAASMPIPDRLPPTPTRASDLGQVFLASQIAQMAGLKWGRMTTLMKSYPSHVTAHNGKNRTSRRYSIEAVDQLRKIDAQARANREARSKGLKVDPISKGEHAGTAAARVRDRLQMDRIEKSHLALARQIRDIRKLLAKLVAKPLRLKVER